MKRKLIIIVIVLLIFGGIAYKLAANKKVINENKKQDQTEVVIPVTTITTQYQEVNNKLIKSGTLIPYKEADITSVSAGKLTHVNFELGDFVSKGTVLATVDNAGLKLDLQAAMLSKDKAEKDYKRSQALLAGDATTTMDYQTAKLQYDNANNKIQQIKKQIADNKIIAPLSGQIIAKGKEAGEYVSPGTILGHLVEVNRLKVDVMVNEENVYHLEKNQSVKIKTDVYPNTTFEGKIIFISEKGDDVHNYQVEVAIRNNKKEHPLRAGSFAYVDFEQNNKKKQILIPKSSLIESLDHPMVYVIKDGKAQIKEITPGASYDNNIAVASGLDKGEQVITSGLVNISEGTPVKPVKK